MNYTKYDHLSTAVLTPELIDPEFFQMQRQHLFFRKSEMRVFPSPLTQEQKIHRGQWSIRQLSILAQIPSTAVLEVTLNETM